MLRTCVRRVGSFAASKRGDFYQRPPTIGNQYDEDPFLRECLANAIPARDALRDVEADLRQFGHQVATNVLAWHYEAERHPPYLEHFDAWGNRVDTLHTCNAWKQMKHVSAVEGLVAIAYERQLDVYSRIYQMAKLFLFAPSSGMYSCPLAMTDGAASVLRNVATAVVSQDFDSAEAFARLTTRDPQRFWTSGQWMTERQGGSDVSTGTETIARLEHGNTYKLNGYKWFSSATDSDMTLTLARIQDNSSSTQSGGHSVPLTLFAAHTRKTTHVDGEAPALNQLNGIEVQRLKNKLGTRQLPTAELLLDGMIAYKISESGKGVSQIASMLNITRIHNSIAAISNMRRIINLARDYATKRRAFGRLIIENRLHCRTLSQMEVECRASFLNLMFVAQLLGKSECGVASTTENQLLRLLIPLMKLYTGKQAVWVASEGLEAFGGQGYIEDTGLPNYLRDGQVLCIWEGTTNILSGDVLRSIHKTKGDSLKVFSEYVKLICAQGNAISELEVYSEMICKQTNKLLAVDLDSDVIQAGSRDFSFSLYRLFTASLIIEKCIKSGMKETDIHLLKMWCLQDLTPFLTQLSSYNKLSYEQDKVLLMEGHPSFSNHPKNLP